LANFVETQRDTPNLDAAKKILRDELKYDQSMREISAPVEVEILFLPQSL